MRKVSKKKVKPVRFMLVLLALFSLSSCETLQRKQPELVIEVVVEGPTKGDDATVQILPDRQETAERLQESSIELPEKNVSNGEYIIEIPMIINGGYVINIDTIEAYYREPKGYIFEIADKQIVRKPGNLFRFKLIPPAQQSLPPC